MNLGLVLLFLLYISAGLFGISLVTIENSSLTLVWLPAGIGVVMSIKYGKQGLIAVFTASFIVNSFSYFGANSLLQILKWLSVTLVACSIDTLQSYLARLLGGEKLREPSLMRKSELLKVGIKIVLLPPLLTCWVLVANNYFFGFIANDASSNTLSVLVQSFIFLNIADASGIFLILPLFLSFASIGDIKKLAKPLGIALLLSLIVVSFASHLIHYSIYLAFISLLFLAYHYRMRGASIGVFTLSLSIIILSSRGIGVFSDEASKLESYAHILVFIFSTGSVFYLVSALFEELEEKSKLELLLIQQSKMAMMGEMIGAIAHQWRQPLNSLAMTVQDVELAYHVGEVNEEYLARFKSDSMRTIQSMSSTIEDFRRFFSPNKKTEDFFVEDVIAESIKILESQLKLHSVEVIFDNDLTKNHQYTGYKNELKQVLLNILANAKDALFEKKPEKAFIKIEVNAKADKSLEIVIEDSAGGIPEEILEKIFEPYFTTKSDDKGTGIGLYMSKQIVEESLHGKLSVSNTDNGARFIVELPK